MKLFYGYFSAVRKEEGDTYIVHIKSFLIVQEVKFLATAQAYNMARETFPSSEEYFDHKLEVEEVPQEWGKQCYGENK